MKRTSSARIATSKFILTILTIIGFIGTIIFAVRGTTNDQTSIWGVAGFVVFVIMLIVFFITIFILAILQIISGAADGSGLSIASGILTLIGFFLISIIFDFILIFNKK